jgi:transposase
MTKDKNEFLIHKALNALRGENSRERSLHRLHTVALVLQGLSPADAASLYGDSPRAVAYWVKKFKSDGTPDLTEKRRSGRPAQLSELQTLRLHSYIRERLRAGDPITAKSVSTYVQTSFGVMFSRMQCWRIIRFVKENS